MASSSTPVHPARYLALFLVLLVGAYLLVFLTGDKKADPKLGIDLQGGTRVTLTARTPDGSPPTRDALNQAQTIINARVNGLGVSGSEVIIDGDNLVITVPGNDSSEARNLGQTARLYIRPVIHAMPCRRRGSSRRPRSPRRTPRCSAGRDPRACRQECPGMPGLPPGAEPGAAVPAGKRRAACRAACAVARAAAASLPRSRRPARTRAAPDAQPRPRRQARARAGSRDAGTRAAARDIPLAQRIADEKELRQSTDQQIQILALQFQATRCGEDDVLAGNDDPNLPLVTCSQDGNEVYLLDKSIISGEQIENASSGLDQQQGQYVVDLQFKSDATKIWADFTAANVGTQTAFVLDSKVVSAPEIRSPFRAAAPRSPASSPRRRRANWPTC